MMAVELQDKSLSSQVRHCRRLAKVLTVTRQMLVSAEEGDWDTVADMESQRREDLVACFAQPVPLGDTELVAEAMATLLHLNEELMAKLRVARSAVMAQGMDFTKSRQALSTYHAVDAAIQPGR